jgi:hypothetical protein
MLFLAWWPSGDTMVYGELAPPIRRAGAQECRRAARFRCGARMVNVGLFEVRALVPGIRHCRRRDPLQLAITV